jgi:hypothetical protein
MKGYEHAKETLQTIFDSSYVDLSTKAVFIDTTIFNPDVPGFFYVRLVVELGVTGGASSSVDLYFFRPYHFFSKDGYEMGSKGGVEGVQELINEIMLMFCHLYVASPRTLIVSAPTHVRAFILQVLSLVLLHRTA